MKYFIIILFGLLMFSCENSNDSANSGFNGTWNIEMYDTTTPTTISTTSNSMNFYGTKYNGSYSGNSFNGTYEDEANYMTTKLNITVNNDYISGSLKVTVDYNGHSNSNTEYFNGTRRK
jgi:hypothetical protein